MSRHKIKNARGIAVVVLAILLPLILGFVSLVIDYGLGVSAIQQARAHARLLSLAATEKYYEEAELNPAQSTTARLEKVRDHLEAMRDFNHPISAGEEAREPIELAFSERQDNSTKPLLIPGQYFTSDVPVSACDGINKRVYTCDMGTCHAPAGGPSGAENVCSPCGSGSGQMAPCFVPWDTMASAKPSEEPVPSAFKVEGNLYPSLGMKFAKILIGNASLPIKVSAVSSIIPRRMVAVVDISNSSAQETYKPRQIGEQRTTPELGRGKNYTFPNTIPLQETHPHNTYGTLANGSNYYDFSSPLDIPLTGGPYGFWRFLRNWDPDATNPVDGTPGWYSSRGLTRERLQSENPSSPLLDSPIVHFYDDYELKTTAGTPTDSIATTAPTIDANHHPDAGDCSGSNPSSYCQASEGYLIDVVGRPEPLGSVLEGLQRAVEAFQARRVAGDQMGLVFFEKHSSWSRIIKATDDFSYLEKILGSSPESAELRYKLKIFPTNERFTDLNAALTEAVNLLANTRGENPGLVTHDDILLISDGLTNCAQCVTPGGVNVAEVDFNHDGAIGIDDLFMGLNCFFTEGAEAYCGTHFNWNSIDAIFHMLDAWFSSGACAGSFGCSNDYPHYKSAIDGVKTAVQNQTGLNIPVNVLAVGGLIGPNMVDIPSSMIDPSSSARCLTDSEVRGLDPATTPGAPFDITLPSCGNTADCTTAFNNMSNEPFVTANNDLYWIARLSGGVFAPLFSQKADFCTGSPDLCVNNPNSSQCCKSGTVEERTWRSDKLCRSQTEQVEALIDSIMKKQTPFAVMESN